MVNRQRIKDYIKYHIKGDANCNNEILKAYCDKHDMSQQERSQIGYFFSCTYSVPSSIIIYENQDQLDRDYKKFAEQYKETLLFQSDRKYVKMQNNFEKCLKGYREKCARLDKQQAENIFSIERALKECEQFDFFGRFSAFLLIETLIHINNLQYEDTDIPWENGDTATSGMLNLLGKDKDANEFDKTQKLYISTQQLNKAFEHIKDEIHKVGGEASAVTMETSLCAYRKWIKGSRYNGYYLDRMLEELNTLQPKFPDVCQEVYDLRRKIYPEIILGERMGWNGIRTEKKKEYITTMTENK